MDELAYAQNIAQILMLKAYHWNIPQTVQLTCGDDVVEVTFTRENVEHLIPLEFRHPVIPFVPSKSKSRRYYPKEVI